VRRPVSEPVNLSKGLKTFVIHEKPKLTLIGYSKSTDKTAFSVPELKLMLDAGYCKRDMQPEFLFLTHGHDDHCKDLPYAATKKGGLTIWCPNSIVNYVDAFLLGQFQLNSSKNLEKLNWTIHGVKAGDEIHFGKNNHRVTVIDCIHSVPCVGFCFDEKRTRLKSMYQNLKSDQLVKLRQEGAELQETWYKPLFVYIGDTDIDVFTQNPIIFQYPNIIVECTFLYNEQEVILKAKKDGHIHWNDLKPIIISNPTNTFILIHFSLRYTEQEIIDFFDSEYLPNIIVYAGEC